MIALYTKTWSYNPTLPYRIYNNGHRPFLWIGIGMSDRYPFPDPDPPFITRSFADPDPLFLTR